MTYKAIIHYMDGSIGSTDVEIQEESFLGPFTWVNAYIGQKWQDNQRLLYGVFDYNRKGFLTNQGEEILDGWQKVPANFVDYISINVNGGYIYLPASDINHRSRSAMIDQLKRAFI